jgi:hypothetical protein
MTEPCGAAPKGIRRNGKGMAQIKVKIPMFFAVVGTGHTPSLPPSVSLHNNNGCFASLFLNLSSLCVADESIDLY